MISDKQMLKEVLEISDKVCSVGEIDFLEECEVRLNTGKSLPPRKHDWLASIHKRNCTSQR